LNPLTFLDLNGCSIDHPCQVLVEITLQVAAGSVGKDRVATVLRELAGGTR
jgi:prophage maintenance system killer protein